MPEAIAGPVHTYGAQTLAGHRLFAFLLSLLSVGHLLALFARSADNLLLRTFSPSLGNVSVSAPVELSLTFPRLLVLRLGLNSHSH